MYRVFWSGEGHVWIATTEAFRGLSGVGDSPTNALQELRTAERAARELVIEEVFGAPAKENPADRSRRGPEGQANGEDTLHQSATP